MSCSFLSQKVWFNNNPRGEILYNSTWWWFCFCCSEDAWFSGNHIYWFEVFQLNRMIFRFVSGFRGLLLQSSHARSACWSDWWTNRGFWRSGLWRRFSKGHKTALDTEDWHTTLPITAPSRQLRIGWRSNLDQRSAVYPSSGTACDPRTPASWQGAGSGHHGGMWGKWW